MATSPFTPSRIEKITEIFTEQKCTIVSHEIIEHPGVTYLSLTVDNGSRELITQIDVIDGKFPDAAAELEDIREQATTAAAAIAAAH